VNPDRRRILHDLRMEVGLLPAACLTANVLPDACASLPDRSAAISRHQGFVAAIGKVLTLLDVAEQKAVAIPCCFCHGTGTVHRMRHRGVQVGECPKCGGSGWIENAKEENR
jgi:hypothetical protein